MTADARPLLIVGAGGFARETAEAVRAVNAGADAPVYDLLGFLDDDPARRGTDVDGLPVLGTTDELDRWPDALVVVATGRPGDYDSRRRIVTRTGLPPERYATVVHPSAVVPASARLGEGSVLLAGVVLTHAVEVGRHVAVMPGVVLTHDDALEDFVTVASGVRLGGGVRVAEGAYVGAGALVREGLRVGRRALVGMGAVVTRDVPDDEVWAGVPARRLRAATAPSAPRVRRIPLVDLQAQHRQVADEVRRGMERVMDATSFVGGKEVAAFEQEYADHLGVRYCVGVGNGTDALEIALRAIGVGRGDEVVLPANTFVATAEAVVRAGATPVLVDVDPLHHLMDPDAVERALTPRTRVVLPVHLYGQAAPVEELVPLAERVGAVVVEDAAQAQGARRWGRPAGGLGLAAGTSFYPGKNLGAYGDAGAVLTDDEGVAHRARLIANHGSETKYDHRVFGFNSRLDTLQAVVLRAKLAHLDRWNASRRAAAERYDALLADLDDVVRPATLAGNEHVWHLYVVRVPGRDEVLARLNESGIGAGVHYPVPIHLTGAFRHLGHRPGDFPVTEASAPALLSLPLFPEITAGEQERVCDELRRALT